jgi:thymidine phosphorylase
VKYGTGAFMRTRKQAEELAAAMIGVGREMGVEVHALLHPMSEPTGRAIGNALEVAEARECLCGGGPGDLRNVVLDLAVMVSGTTREELEQHLDNGGALQAFERMVEAQGGNPADLTRIAEIHRAPLIREVLAPATGVVARVDAGLLGQASVQLGAGRAKVTDSVDFAVGFDQLVKCGDPIHHGQPVCRIHARSAVDFEIAEALVEKAIVVDA